MNGVRVAAIGPEGGKRPAVDTTPPDTFRSRTLNQWLPNGISTVTDHAWRPTRDGLDLIDSHSGSPFGSSPKDRSPQSLQEAFVRDVGNHWSPSKVPRRNDWSDKQRHYDRGDRWVPQLRRSSPPRRASPPPRRPSPPRQSSSGYGEPLRSPLAHPPSAHARHMRHLSDTFQKPHHFSNLTWKASDQPKSQFNDTGSSAAQDSEAIHSATSPYGSHNGSLRDFDTGKVAYNGLKDVPTGPKKGLGGIPPAILPEIKNRPHIFISSQHLPPLRSTLEHLYGAVRRFVARESDVHFDDSGWYLCFEDTDAGRGRLQDCYERKDQMRLFGCYTIHMQPFSFGIHARTVPNGDGASSLSLNNGKRQLSDVNDKFSAVSVLKDGTTEMDTRSDTATRAPVSTADFCAFGWNHSLSSVSNAVIDSGATKAESAMSKALHDVDSASLPERDFHLLRHSSPLRVPSRIDRDDSMSSISVLTGSDSSLSSRLKCHVCKTGDPFDIDSLVSCSSCPRRYHRRCHIRSAIPAEIDGIHSWQCRRCIKKRVQPRSSLRGSSPGLGLKTPHAMLREEEPPLKRLRLDSAQPQTTPRSGLLESTVDNEDRAFNRIHEPTSSLAKEPAQDATDVPNLLKNPVPNSDETHFLEADDLVAKSFAPSEPGTYFPPSATATPRKSKLVRRKVARPEQPSDSEAPVRLDSSLGYPRDELTLEVEDPLAEANGMRQSNVRTPHEKPEGFMSNGAVTQQMNMSLSTGGASARVRTVTNGFMENELSTSPSVSDLAVSSEIPESPEELRGSSTHVVGIAGPTKILRDSSAITTDRNELALMAEKEARGEMNKEEPRAKLQRTKPGTQMADRCRNCSKKIAYNPSGANKLCMKCKATASAISTADSTKSATDTRLKALPDPRAPSSRDDKLSGAVAREAGEPNLSKPMAAEPTSMPAPRDLTDAQPRKTKMQKSCEKCKLWHRRCTHSESADDMLVDPAPPESENSMNSRDVEGDAQDVLDFWTTNADKDDATDVDNEPPPNLTSQALPPEMSDLSDAAEEEADDAPRTAVTKRKSQTRKALSQHDLGDSIERPKGAYEKLIGMALCSAPNYRMRGSDVTQWVAKNISGYKIGEGKWENSLRATLTLKKQGYDGKDGRWRKVEAVGAKKNEVCWWELLPGQEYKMLHWDPALGQPVSPPKPWRKERPVANVDESRAASDEDMPSVAAPAVLQARHKKALERKRLRQGQSGQTKAPNSFERDREEPQTTAEHPDFNDSSDEEPLVTRKRPRHRSPKPAEDVDMVDAAESPATGSVHAGESFTAADMAPSKPAASAGPLPMEKIRAAKFSANPATIEDMIAMEAEDTVYTAKSLFAEWPEHDPKKQFDRDAKIAQIKKRPTRKQRFRMARKQKSSKQNVLAEMSAPDPAVECTIFSESPSKTNRSLLYPWEATEDNIIQCATLEELFQLPKNPVAILHDGQLAYRDGTRNEEGKLPRAKVIYKTGYGKGDSSR